jgi:hypothetical protein
MARDRLAADFTVVPQIRLVRDLSPEAPPFIGQGAGELRFIRPQKIAPFFH